MLITRDHGPIRELQLNRPPANAIAPDLITALTRALASAPKDGARAIVLSGAPGMFCAGLDVPLLLTLDRPTMAVLWRDFYALLRTLACSPIPIAAAITGHAPAGGTVLSLFCDWRVMAEGNWKIGLNEVQVGLPLPPVIFLALRRQIGPRHAERMAAGASLISPAEALSMGLVDELAPPADVVTRAVHWCQTLIALPEVAMAATRDEGRADLAAMFKENMQPELEKVTASWWSEEAQKILHEVAEKLARKK